MTRRAKKYLLRKRYHHNFNRIVWHNNADLRRRILTPKLAEMVINCSIWCRKQPSEEISPTKWTVLLGYWREGRFTIFLTPSGLNLLQYLTKLNLFLIQVVGFPIDLSPRTMQCLSSVPNLVFHIQVVGFPIGLSPRTMQCLGSVQNLVFHIQVVGLDRKSVV